MQLLLVISGNSELNPGPQNPRYPCGERENAVNINGIVSDTRNAWYHRKCAGKKFYQKL